MSKQPTSTEKKTSADAYAGTSAVQHAEAETTLFRKSHNTTREDTITNAAIGSTNVSSIFWAIQRLNAHGTNAWNFGFPNPVQVFADSQVSVTMTEIDNNGQPFLGLATMQVYNVVPQSDGTITVKFNVDWGNNILVQFNFIIVN